MRRVLLLFNIIVCIRLFAQPPANDNCNGAIQITPGTLNPTQGNAQNATQSYSPVTCGSYTSNQALDVFFKFTATQSSHVISIIPSSGYDPALFVYSGSCNGTLIGCSDAGGGNGGVEQVFLNGLTTNQTYYIKVYDYNNVNSPPSYTYTFDVYVASPTINGNAFIAFSPSSLSFGNVQVSYTGSQTLTISNTGTSDLVFTNISYPNNFSGPSSIPVIEPGNSYPLNVTFSPSSVGTHNGNISFTSNSSTSPDQVSVTGIGTNSPSPQITVSANSLSFGSVQVNSTSAPQQFTIYNSGQANLVISSINMPNNYSSNYNGGTILPGNSVNVSVTFTPPSVGTFTGNIQIVNNATNKIVSVSGGGTIGPPTTITGIVKDIGIVSNYAVNNPIASCTVNLKDINGNVISTTTTNSNGIFTLAAQANQYYTVETSFISNNQTYIVGKTNVNTGSNITILIPQTIYNQIKIKNNNLQNLNIDINNNILHVNGYNVNSSQILIDDYKTYNNTFNPIMSNMIRLYLAENILLEYYNNSALISSQIKDDLSQLTGLLGFFFAVRDKTEILANNSGWLLQQIANLALDIFDSNIDHLIDFIANTSAQLSGTDKSNIEAILHLHVDYLRQNISSDPPSSIDAIQNIVELAIGFTVPKILGDYYVIKTQPSLNSAVNHASDLGSTYNDSNNNAITQTNQVISSTNTHAQQKHNNMENLFNASGIVLDVSTLLIGGGTILGMTGIGAPLSAALVEIGTNLSYVGYAGVIGAAAMGFSELSYLKNKTYTDINNTAFKSINTKSSQSYQSVNLDDAISQFNIALLDVKYDIDYSHEQAAFQKINNIKLLNNNLNVAIKDATNPLFSCTTLLLDSLTNFQDIYRNQFIQTLANNYSLRIALSLELIALMSDTTNSNINNTLVDQIDMIIGSNNYLQTTISQFDNLCAGIRSEPYPMITDKVYNNFMNKNSTQTIKIKFKNYSNDTLYASYVKIDMIGTFTIPVDSFFIGSVLPNSDDSILFNVMAPNIDTTGGYLWYLHSDNAQSLGTGGSLTTKQKNATIIQTSKSIEFNAVPNPSSQNIDVSFHKNIKSDVTIKLIDLNGKEVYKNKSEGLAGNQKISINSSIYPTGTYLLLLNTEGHESVKKIIIQH